MAMSRANAKSAASLDDEEQRIILESMLKVSLKNKENEEKELQEELQEEEEKQAELEQSKQKFKYKKDQEDYEDEQAIKTTLRQFGPDLLNPDDGIGIKVVYDLLCELIEGIDVETCERWFEEYDTDGNGLIDMVELIHMLLAKLIIIKDTQEEVIEAFQIFDPMETGFIESTEMRHILYCMGDPLSDQEINIFMKEGDIDGDGNINYEEFVKVMFGKKVKVEKLF